VKIVLCSFYPPSGLVIMSDRWRKYGKAVMSLS
jgi:hypothetical protein